MKATVLKDGHIFSVHILDPKENSVGSDDEDDTDSKKDEKEKSEYEKSEKDGEINHSTFLANSIQTKILLHHVVKFSSILVKHSLLCIWCKVKKK